MTLNSKQRRYLRSLAHALIPVVMVGANRITDAVVSKVDDELENHELIKVKFLDADRDVVQEGNVKLCGATQSTSVQIIGRVLVLYRRRSEEPTIRLPRA